MLERPLAIHTSRHVSEREILQSTFWQLCGNQLLITFSVMLNLIRLSISLAYDLPWLQESEVMETLRDHNESYRGCSPAVNVSEFESLMYNSNCWRNKWTWRGKSSRCYCGFYRKINMVKRLLNETRSATAGYVQAVTGMGPVPWHLMMEDDWVSCSVTGWVQVIYFWDVKATLHQTDSRPPKER